MSNKLDRLVAERVMGWRTHARNTAWWVDAEVENGLVPSGGVRGFTCGTDRWSPSISISAAWEVVEKVDGRRFGVNITRVKSVSGGDLSWATDLNQPFDNGAYGNGDDANICVSICLAALRAVGVPEAEIMEAMQ